MEEQHKMEEKHNVKNFYHLFSILIIRSPIKPYVERKYLSKQFIFTPEI